MVYDKRAVKILFDTYWESGGWKLALHPGSSPDTRADDLEYAVDAGLMFPPRRLSHNQAIAAVASLRAQIAPEQVGAAFAASLSRNQPVHRSALGTLAVARHLPLHSMTPAPTGIYCTICGCYDLDRPYDLNILNFERHKWGGVRHDDPVYIAFDLERFLAEPSGSPSAEDRQILNSILKCVDAMPAEAKLSDLVKSTRPLVPGNEAQRRTIIELLGYSGVLRIPGRSSYLRSFTSFRDREHTPWSKDDWGYPTRWWRGGNGVDREAAQFWFGAMVL